MDEDEARGIAFAQLRELRVQPYDELRSRLLDRSERVEVAGSSGAHYQVELRAVIDGPGETLRVMASVDDRGLTDAAPITDDFLVSPQGTFIRE
jgi:hypothetical protein